MKNGSTKNRKCSLNNCDNPHSCKGYCAKHYKHFKNTGRTCSIDGCNRQYEAKGLCSLHYVRFITHGDASLTKLPRGVGDTPTDRFWSRVEKKATGCWEWQGKLNANGYGSIFFNSRSHGTHRVAWFLHYGKWPQGLLRHSCDNPPCCNPSHLSIGTHADNAQDMLDRQRQSRGEHRPNAKLTEMDVQAILREPEVWGFQTQLARRYNVPTSTISRIRQRKIWRHVTIEDEL